MVGVSSAPVTAAAQGSFFLLPYSVQTPKHGPEAWLSEALSVCNDIQKEFFQELSKG